MFHESRYMSNKNLLVLSIVAVVTLTWAVFQSQIASSRAKRPQRASFEESYLIQGLDLSSIASIRIGSGEDPLRLVRRGTQFTIASKNDYPADTQKINSLLVDLTDLRISELVTDDAENHESLKVSEENAESLIRFFDSNDTLITGVAIGSRHVVEGGSGPSQRYVRLLSSPNVFLAEDVPTVSDSALEYVNKELLSLENDEITQVAVSAASGPDYVLKASQEGAEAGYLLENPPEGRELDESQAESLVSAFTNVMLQEVYTAEELGQGLNPAGTVVCTLKNEVAYRFELLKKDDKSYARLSADYLGDTQIVKENRVESDEELKAKETKLLARDTAESFTQLHQGWIYEIQQWKADKLLTARDDLLKKIEAPAEAAPDSGAESIPTP